MFIQIHGRSPYENYLMEIYDRIELDDYDRTQYYRLEQGYLGELMFYDYMKHCGGAKLWNIRLDSNGESQYDFLVIHNGHLIHFDVKNFSGYYTYSGQNFISEHGYVIKDPLSQLSRAHMKLIQFCSKHQLHYKLSSYLIFINENFQVTGFNGHNQILFHRDLPQLVSSLTHPPNESDIKTMEYIARHHKHHSRYERIKYYPFNELRTGIKCPECRVFLRNFHDKERRLICGCGRKISKSEAVHIAFDCISLLKNDAVKTSEIAAFTGIGHTTIKNIMRKHYQSQGMNRNRSYYKSGSSIMLKEDSSPYIIESNLDYNDNLLTARCR